MAIAMMSTFTVTYAIYDNLVEANENGEYVESIEDNNESVSDEVDNVNIKMEEFRKNNIATLLSKGVILNNKDIIHSVKETQFI